MRFRTALVLASLAVPAAFAPPAAAGDLPSIAPVGTPSWLGVSMDSGGLDGVTVRHVVRSSPAQKAGIKEGDRIVRLEGQAVVRAAEVTRAIASRAAGEVVTLAVARDGREVSVKAVLEPRPSADEVLRMDHVGAFAPAWTKVTPVAGAPKAMAQLRGRVVLVDFWATWCGPCRLMAPRLSALQARFGAQGLTVVGITTDDAEKAAAFAQKVDMRYGVVIDSEGDTTRAYGVSGLPTMFIVDKRGVVREVEVGFDPSGGAELERVIKELLAEPAPAQ